VRDLKVIWRVAGAKHAVSDIKPRTHRTAALPPFEHRGLRDLELLDISGSSREVGRFVCTHLYDRDLFQHLLWLFLEAIAQSDGSGGKDVNVCLDERQLCLTRISRARRALRRQRRVTTSWAFVVLGLHDGPLLFPSR